MKIIVTRPNEDGTYDEVGMVNRVIFGKEARNHHALLACLHNLNVSWRGKKLRVEYLNSLHDGKPRVDWVQI